MYVFAVARDAVDRKMVVTRESEKDFILKDRLGRKFAK